MRTNRSIPAASIIPELAYADVPAAAAWLCNAFGFKERLRIGDHRVQLLAGDGGGALVVMDASRESGAPPSGHGILVRVDDANAHHARALADPASWGGTLLTRDD